MLRSVRTVVFVIICAVALAGCGGGGKPNATSGGTSLALEFAKCMRAHGVPDFPDPGTPAGNVVDASSPAVKKAGATCNRLEPNNPQPSGKPSEARIHTAFQTARCMRAHGVNDFPDPTLNPPSGSGVIDAAGVFFVLPPGLVLSSPAVHRAAHACGLGPA
jgi:hypothetical protein